MLKSKTVQKLKMESRNTPVSSVPLPTSNTANYFLYILLVTFFAETSTHIYIPIHIYL